MNERGRSAKRLEAAQRCYHWHREGAAACTEEAEGWQRELEAALAGARTDGERRTLEHVARCAREVQGYHDLAGEAERLARRFKARLIVALRTSVAMNAGGAAS